MVDKTALGLAAVDLAVIVGIGYYAQSNISDIRKAIAELKTHLGATVREVAKHNTLSDRLTTIEEKQSELEKHLQRMEVATARAIMSTNAQISDMRTALQSKGIIIPERSSEVVAKSIPAVQTEATAAPVAIVIPSTEDDDVAALVSDVLAKPRAKRTK